MNDNKERYLANTAQFIASDLGDEMILLNLETGDYIALNAVSADIWKQAEKEVSAEQIIDQLMQQYEVDKEVCKTETLECVSELVEKHLLLKLA